MIKEVIATGNSVAEAQASACKQLEKEGKEIKFEILDLPEKKVLGIFGGRLARVRAYVEVDDCEEGLNCSSNCDCNNEDISSCVDESTNEFSLKEQTIHEYEQNKEKAAQTAVEYLNNIITKIYNDDCDLKISYKLVSKGIDINIDGDDLKTIIGYRGEVLESLQYLTNLYIKNVFEGKCNRIFLNIADYREKRERTLTSLAQKKAFKAKKIHRQVSVEPMSAYDRRIIHSTVQTIKGVTSWSEGNGIYRHVVIAPSERENRSMMNRYSTVRDNNSSNYSSSLSDEIEIKDSEGNTIKDEAPEAPLYGKIDL